MSVRIALLINFMSDKGRAAGWSTTFYNAAESPDTVKPYITALASAINDLMGKQSVPVAYRANVLSGADNAIVTGKRTIAVRRLDFGVPGQTGGDPGATPEKVLVMRDSAVGGSRTWYLHGIPDAKEAGGGDFVSTGAYQTKLQALFALLSTPGNGWKIRIQDQDVPKVAVSSITLTGTVTTAVAHGLAQDDWVHLTGGRGKDVFNGRYRVDFINATTFRIRANPQTAFVINEGADPRSQKEKLVLRDYSTPAGAPYATAVVRSGSHPVGRPFDLLTGRRTRAS